MPSQLGVVFGFPFLKSFVNVTKVLVHMTIDIRVHFSENIKCGKYMFFCCCYYQKGKDSPKTAEESAREKELVTLRQVCLVFSKCNYMFVFFCYSLII